MPGDFVVCVCQEYEHKHCSVCHPVYKCTGLVSIAIIG